MVTALLHTLLENNEDVDYDSDHWVGHYEALGVSVSYERNVIRDLNVEPDHPRANVIEYRYVIHGKEWKMRMNQRTADMNDPEKAENRHWEVEGDEDRCLTDLSILRLSGVE